VTGELDTYSELSRALWANPELSRRKVVDAFGIAGLLNLPNHDERLDWAARTMLEQARASGSLSVAAGVENPFYRLSVEERFALTALHDGRWSYVRLAKVLDMDLHELQELAWSARTRLSRTRYPAGPMRSGINCPEYLVARPWTQKFLDEELASGAEQLFYRNHLMACDSCREALTRAREFYFDVERRIPAESAKPYGDSAKFELRLEGLLTGGAAARAPRTPSERTFAESLRIFFNRPDIQRVTLVGLLLLGVWIARHLG
jgi:hypothetical protein